MTAVEVCLYPETPVGTLYLNRRRGAESATFAYAPSWLAHPGAYPLDPALPLAGGAFHSPGRLFGAMADSSPDRWGRTLVTRTLATEAAQQQGAARQPGEADFLLGVRDDLRQGALRYRLADAAEGVFLAQDQAGVPAVTDLATLLRLAERVLSDDADLGDLRRLVGAGSSLGGARPKAHVRLPGGGFGIAKFPSATYDGWNVMAWEHVMLTLAAEAGIGVPPHRLVPVDGRDVLLVERFDRRGTSRLGYVSAMTMLEATDGERASYLDIAEVLEVVSPRAATDLPQLWRRLVFGALVNNTDDHLRNHGFLRHAGGWILAPAFDLNPTPFVADFATDVADPGDGGSLEAALSVADYFRLSPPAAQEVLEEVTTAVAGWDAVAARAGLGENERRRMAPAFARLPR